MTEKDEIDAIVKNLDDYLERRGGCVLVSRWAVEMLKKYHPEIEINYVVNLHTDLKQGINAVREQ